MNRDYVSVRTHRLSTQPSALIPLREVLVTPNPAIALLWQVACRERRVLSGSALNAFLRRHTWEPTPELRRLVYQGTRRGAGLSQELPGLLHSYRISIYVDRIYVYRRPPGELRWTEVRVRDRATRRDVSPTPDHPGSLAITIGDRVTVRLPARLEGHAVHAHLTSGSFCVTAERYNGAERTYQLVGDRFNRDVPLGRLLTLHRAGRLTIEQIAIARQETA